MKERMKVLFILPPGLKEREKKTPEQKKEEELKKNKRVV